MTHYSGRCVTPRLVSPGWLIRSRCWLHTLEVVGSRPRSAMRVLVGPPRAGGIPWGSVGAPSAACKWFHQGVQHPYCFTLLGIFSWDFFCFSPKGQQKYFSGICKSLNAAERRRWMLSVPKKMRPVSVLAWRHFSQSSPLPFLC